MAALTTDTILAAAARILLEEDRALAVTCSEEGITIRFPTTRRLAEYLGVPHYYVLPLFAAMEEDGVITRTERVGISTTAEGTRRLFLLIEGAHSAEAERLLGRDLYDVLRKRVLG
jgi:Mn-dependent DtxR family transcriptional regulator